MSLLFCMFEVTDKPIYIISSHDYFYATGMFIVLQQFVKLLVNYVFLYLKHVLCLLKDL